MAEGDDVIEGEVVEEPLGELQVVAEVRALEEAAAARVPVVQAAAMTAGGFFAGALAMAMVKRVAARRAELGPLREARSWPAGTSRTYVVNVRLIHRSD